MTPLEFRQQFDDRCRTNSTIFSDDKLLRMMRTKQLVLARQIESVDEDYFMSIETCDLLPTPGTGEADATREYPLPDDMLDRMKLVEAYLDGQWVRLKPFDINLYESTTDETAILNNFANTYGSAYYDVGRHSIFLYTGEVESTVTAGMKWTGYTLPREIENLTEDTIDMSVPSTTRSGIPISFHELWLDACVIEWKSNRDKPIPLTEREASYEYHLAQALDNSKELNRDYANTRSMPVSQSDNGWNY